MNYPEYQTELLPWMVSDYQRLVALSQSGKLAHAYLLGGQEGLGKLALARHFAHYLLCSKSRDNQPCERCRECQLLGSGTHPDLKIIEPEDSSEIKIDQVRQTIDFVSQTSGRGRYKVVIYRPAEAMNTNSANALLKVLEEPSASTLLFLVSHQPALLMATIRSRCHAIRFNRPAPDMVIPWLESKNISVSASELLRMAHNLPLRALQLADEDAFHDRTVLHDVLEKLLKGEIEITRAAAECEGFSVQENIESMLLCTADILAYNQSQQQSGENTLHDHDLKTLADFFQTRTRLTGLHIFYGELLHARRAVSSTSNPNPLLVLESLFYNWAGIVHQPVPASSGQ